MNACVYTDVHTVYLQMELCLITHSEEVPVYFIYLNGSVSEKMKSGYIHVYKKL